MEAECDSVLDCNLVSFISSRDSSTRTSDFSSLPTVRERLKLYINFWRFLGALQFIRNAISLGYKIPFSYLLPTPFFKANNASAFSNSLFVSHAVNELLHANLVEEISCFACLILSTRFQLPREAPANKSLDLRHVNSFLFDKGFHLFKFDLMSGFHHIEIFHGASQVSYVSALRPSVWAVFSRFRIYKNF